MDLTNEDVTDILALLDSLPYDELDLQTPRFRLTLRRTPDGWTQSVESRSVLLAGPGAAPGVAPETGSMEHPAGYNRSDVPSNRLDSDADGANGADGGLVAVRAPLPGTFYRAPRPGAAPFVQAGDEVAEDTVVAIVETMKLMNSVHAGTRGRVAEICLENAEPVAQSTTLMWIEP